MPFVRKLEWRVRLELVEKNFFIKLRTEQPAFPKVKVARPITNSAAMDNTKSQDCKQDNHNHYTKYVLKFHRLTISGHKKQSISQQ